jgi:uncharacterized protein (TIGR03067 family)
MLTAAQLSGPASLAVAVFLLPLWLPAPAAAKPDDGKADLEGKWELTAWERDGERTENREGANFVPVLFTVKGDTFTREAGVPFVFYSKTTGRFQVVGADRRVFKVDVQYSTTTVSGKGEEKREDNRTGKELWELVDKNTLRICRTEGKDRPDGFTTRKDDSRIVLQFGREKR